MRGNHFIMIFVMIAITLLGLIDLETDELLMSTHKKIEMDDAFFNAVDAGTRELIVATEQGERLEKDKASQMFFYTLMAALGIQDEPYQQELLKLYVPVIAVTGEDGFYILYSDEYQNGSSVSISKRWSEMIPYVYEDDDFIYRFTLGDEITLYDKKGILGTEEGYITMNHHDAEEPDFAEKLNPSSILLNDETYELTKRNVIISKLEEYMNYYVNEANDISGHFGITYEFILPEVDHSEWIRSVADSVMIVVFQGYPYNNGRAIYNQFVVSGARIKRSGAYYIVPEGWYFIYHKDDCSHFIKGSEITTCYDMKDCALEGAYACPYCCPEGVIKK